MGNFVSLSAYFRNHDNTFIPVTGSSSYLSYNTRIDGDVNFYSDSIFDTYLAQPYFGANYEKTSDPDNRSYTEYMKIYNGESPFDIKAGNNYIIGKGNKLHALSKKWTADVSRSQFKSCWNISQNVIKTAPTHPETQTTYNFGGSVAPGTTKSFSTTLSSVTFNVVSGAASLLQSSDFSASNFSYSTDQTGSTQVSDATISVSSISWAFITGDPNSNTITFTSLTISGTIRNPNSMPFTYQLKITLDAPTYNASVIVTAKAQIYDYASDTYDSDNIYNSRYYYLYYGNSTTTSYLAFTSSRAEYLDEKIVQPFLEVSSNDLLNSNRHPSNSALAPYKPQPSSSYNLTGWDEDSVIYQGQFNQDNHITISMKKVVPTWYDLEDVGLKISSISATEGSYSNNSKFLCKSQSCKSKTLYLPAQSQSSTYRWYLAVGKTTALFKVVYSGDELNNIRVNGSLIIRGDDEDDKRKYDLQNNYMQINFNNTVFNLPSIESSGSVLISSALPVALKFDFDNSKVELYLKVTFSAETPLVGSITWRIKEPFNIPIIVKENATAVDPPYIGQGKKLIGGNSYYSFEANRGYNSHTDDNYPLVFDALFDSQLDKISVIDKLPKNSGNYSLDYWNKAYPSNYSIKYKDSAAGFPATDYRVGVVDSNFIPNFNWSKMTLLRDEFNSTSIDISYSAWTIYKLTSYTTIDSNGQLNYRLSVWYKTNADYSLAGAYDLSSPLLLLKIVAAGGRGGFASTDTNKGGGGGGSGAGAYMVLDLSFTNFSSSNSSKSSNIYICLGRAAVVGQDDYSRPSYVCFAEPKLSGSDYTSYSISIPSFSNYIRLGAGLGGKAWTSDSNYNDGGAGGSFDNNLSDATFSYCYVLNYSNGSKGGRGESNSGGSGQYDSAAKAGDGFQLFTRLTSNRKAKATSNPSLYEEVDTYGGMASTVDYSNVSKVYSPGGGGASSLFSNGVRHTNDGSSDPHDYFGAGGGGGCCYNMIADVWPHSTYPDLGGAAKAILYYIPKSS